MSRRDTVNSIFMRKAETPAPPAGVEKNPDRVRTGAVSAMGASLQEMTEAARAAGRLQAQISSGFSVLEIDPSDISNSSISDRIPVARDAEFDALVASIAEHGQKVPILVRPAPEREGQYQIAYGRRRLRAAAKLGLKVKAIVQNLDDNELVIAQGKENLDRQDLSFIEKALFAYRLEEADYPRDVIMAALSTDKADLSRYISVARGVPQTVIMAIGPAPKAGRTRWLALVDAVSSSPKKVEAIIEDDAFTDLDSDQRLQCILSKMALRDARKVTGTTWRTRQGQKAAQIEHAGNKTRITFDERFVPEFADYLTTRLDELFDEFDAVRSQR
ncbi:ParB family chromosome partitioning protein [Rhizobium sp. BK529]|uniref:plasmid partitioning protein RepB n=1 Tax=unclassified Rhizobium TaxID=2613769 RepID=UPI00104A2C94|nr:MULTISPECIES: plasmid partitioning protein RepB [unclassified Rhizobium]MBB3593891.1 ParB family chromosome partitioning protein [Rhizobium sp. BK529]TCS01348.1 ParB family protein [Rhizobium sp. BK418]